MYSPIINIESKILKEKNVSLYLKRDDLIHPMISGNKWRKLKYNIEEIKNKNYKRIISFGGAYSNHMHALSYACKINNIELVCVIRGEELTENSSKTIRESIKYGMIPHFVSRAEYKERNGIEYQKELLNKFKADFIVPEGGTNNLALKGVQELIKEINIDFDYISVACGTGGTISGIIKGLKDNQKAIGISALKGSFHDKEVKNLIGNNYHSKYDIINDYHFGGYAKTKPELINFIKDFRNEYNVQLEQVYTGKMAYAIFDLIEKDYFKENSSIVMIHTGGLQGLDQSLF